MRWGQKFLNEFSTLFPKCLTRHIILTQASAVYTKHRQVLAGKSCLLGNFLVLGDKKSMKNVTPPLQHKILRWQNFPQHRRVPVRDVSVLSWTKIEIKIVIPPFFIVFRYPNLWERQEGNLTKQEQIWTSFHDTPFLCSTKIFALDRWAALKNNQKHQRLPETQRGITLLNFLALWYSETKSFRHFWR